MLKWPMLRKSVPAARRYEKQLQRAVLLLQVEGSDCAGRVEYGFDFYQSSAVPSEPADAVVAASEEAEGEVRR